MSGVDVVKLVNRVVRRKFALLSAGKKTHQVKGSVMRW